MGVWSAIVWTVALFGLSHCYQDKTVLQYLIDNGYSDFVRLLQETHQDTQLNGKGPFTVFAPSNAAINKLSADMMAQLAHNPQQKTVLMKYHITKGYLLIPPLATFDHILTTAGQKIDFLHVGHTVILNNVTRVNAPPNNDIICNNGIVQPIAGVLIPPLYSDENIAAVLVEKDDLFQEFVMALMLTNLTSVIEKGEYTVFAPTNAAIAEHLNDLSGFPVQRRLQIVFELMKHHLVPGTRYSNMLMTGQTLFTLQGTPLSIAILNNEIVVDNAAHVVVPDIPAANGVIQAIDHVLFPGDMLEQLQKELSALSSTMTPIG